MNARSVDLTRWPGIVLRVSREGVILASNGALDAFAQRDVQGVPVVEFLDRDACEEKWQRLLADPDAVGRIWELMFAADRRHDDTRAFSALPADGDDGFWLVEHPAPPRLRQLSMEMAEVNADLNTAQRALVIERSRLASALAEVERSNRALDEFGHAISHDLKAPLRAIRDYVEVLDEPTADDAERRTVVARIGDLAARMRLMIDAALQYARAGRAADRVEQVDTGALARDVVGYLAPPSDVTITIAPGMPVMETEAQPFEQVLRNLISNAITYRAPSDPRIDVSAKQTRDVWTFTVRDNGPGISRAQQEHIWRLFHTSRPGEGTGLGLALVKRIVESHRGTVRVDSEAGQGAAFSFTWPAAPPRDSRSSDVAR